MHIAGPPCAHAPRRRVRKRPSLATLRNPPAPGLMTPGRRCPVSGLAIALDQHENADFLGKSRLHCHDCRVRSNSVTEALHGLASEKRRRHESGEQAECRRAKILDPDQLPEPESVGEDSGARREARHPCAREQRAGPGVVVGHCLRADALDDVPPAERWVDQKTKVPVSTGCTLPPTRIGSATSR